MQRYTPASFGSFDCLKGRDQTVVAHLQACPLLDVTLCLVRGAAALACCVRATRLDAIHQALLTGAQALTRAFSHMQRR
jgi:hypothetical protein